MKKLLSLLLVVLLALTFTGCKNEPKVDPNLKSEGSLTFAEYMNAGLDSEVTIEGFVTMCAYNEKYGNANVYVEDGDGAYYVYRMVVDAAIPTGTKIQVTGTKTEWGGEVEIAEGTGKFKVTSEDKWTPTATDITAILDSEELIKNQNRVVTVKGAEVVASEYDEKDDDGNVLQHHSDAVWFGWENCSTAQDNGDIYFNIKVNNKVYNVCVESDECNNTTEVYKTASELKIGDKVDLTALCYWYGNAVNLHITQITK